MPVNQPSKPRVVELFAGVGGFRLGLEGLPRSKWAGRRLPGSGWRVVWHNQWEPGVRVQHALDCYHERFGTDGLSEQELAYAGMDIKSVMDAVDRGEFAIPEHELLVGGFPCQDYSVAKPQSQSVGIEGVKGVLWWEILRLVQAARPKYLFLENVDRLLKSPASQRGRDFAIMLASLSDEGYEVEWRVINAAEYGFPQKRRRVLLVARQAGTEPREANDVLYRGTLARAFKVRQGPEFGSKPVLDLGKNDLHWLTKDFGETQGQSRFRRAGYMSHRKVWTADLEPSYRGRRKALKDILLKPSMAVEPYRIDQADIDRWLYLKGAKSPERTHRSGSFQYNYSEGAVPFPDDENGPARTILTGEGGRTPSRFKHAVRFYWENEAQDGETLRRLTPIEMERLNGFPDDWTKTGMPEGRRAFMMGNALVVGLVERVGAELISELDR